MILPAINFELDQNTTTSIQREKIEWIYSQSNVVTMFENQISPIKKENVTTWLYDDLILTNLGTTPIPNIKTISIGFELDLEANFDLEIELPVKKAFKVKSKIKKISKFRPQVFID